MPETHGYCGMTFTHRGRRGQGVKGFKICYQIAAVCWFCPATRKCASAVLARNGSTFTFWFRSSPPERPSNSSVLFFVIALGGPAPNEDEDEAGQEEEEPAPEGEEAEDDEHDADVQYEADVMADQRYLDVEDVDFFGRKGSARSLGQQPLKVADPFSSTQPPSFNEATGGGWQVQNLKGLKKKMKFVIKQELSGKDTMDEDQANQVWN